MPDDAAPRPRTIDERLGGLTQTLEIVAAMQRDNEKRFAEIATAIQPDAENIRALVRIAEFHDHRLTNLEDEPQ